MVRGSPCMCMRQMPAPLAAAAASAPGSASARTSLMMSAPAATAARITSGLLVSTEMNTGGLAAQRFDDRDDALEFFVERGRRGAGTRGFAAHVDDGGALADHAPRLRQRRASSSLKRPPSEKESGVTLSTPITTGVPRSRTRSRHCQLGRRCSWRTSQLR